MSKPMMFKNKRVVDAKSPLALEVKPEDIVSSKRKDPANCALARCVIRKKHVISARIGQKFALIEYSSHFERYRVNSPASRAVRDFDKNGTFVAGTYQLMPISASEKLTGKGHPRCRKSGPAGVAVHRRRATRNIFKSKECQ